MSAGRRVRIVGPGRAGQSFSHALSDIGWEVTPTLGRGDDLSDAGRDVDLVLICTPDGAIADVAAAIAPTSAVVAHVSGSRGLDVLAPHTRVAALHPLMSLSGGELGAQRLRDDGWFAVAGDEIVRSIVDDLDGHWFEVADADRATYHAAACVASPHLVALLRQVERLADGIGVPAEAFVNLARGSIDNVGQLGATRALTGPGARGDQTTIDRHLAALPADERELYLLLAEETKGMSRGDR